MLSLNLKQIKSLMYVAVFLGSFSLADTALGNAELSAHFGMNFGQELKLREITKGEDILPNQKNRPFHLGADVLYRQMMDAASLGLGVRYRLAFTGAKDPLDANGNDTPTADDKYKITHHRVALLLNYRFHLDQFFVGAVVGLDIWKSLNVSWEGGASSNNNTTTFKSRHFLWQSIGGQAGLELGYKINQNLLAKVEAGYDLLSFGDLKCQRSIQNNETEEQCVDRVIEKESADADAKTKKFKLNGLYVTLGVGWFFG